MEDLFGQIEFRSKSDSIVMRILRSAMDRTHENLQLMDGPIEFLHERTTFYELAAILVEGGLNIVQEESDILEGSSSKILSDLTEIRLWLQGRIQDMKRLIAEKDRELMERVENETSLKQALEMRDREPSAGTIHDPSKRQDRGSDKDICRLKSSVDQQVLNIKQKLEEEKRSLKAERRARRSRASSPSISFDFLDKERSGSLVFTDDDLYGTASSNAKSLNTKSLSDLSMLNQNVLIRGMSSDIEILKETLDLAFGRMQSADAFPLEKQWRWAVERDVESVMVKGFMSDLQENFDAQLKKKVDFLKDNWLEFISEIRTLLYDLKELFARNEANEKGIGGANPFPKVRRTTSESFLEVGICDQNDGGDNASNLVAKMVKNHESIICKLREKSKWPPSRTKREEKDRSRQERRIQDAITRLENFTKRNHKLVDKSGVGCKNRALERRNSSCKTKTNSSSGKELESYTKKLQEEKDEMCFQTSVMEDISKLLFRSMIKDVRTVLSPNILNSEAPGAGCTWCPSCRKFLDPSLPSDDFLFEESIESLLKENIYIIFLREMAETLNYQMDAFAIEIDLHHLVLIEALKEEQMQTKALKQFDFQERTPRSCKMGADRDDEGLIQKVDSLLRCLEIEEDLILQASSTIKEHSVNNSFVILNCEEMEERNAIEWLITDDESTFCSVSEKLERALQQLYTSKELLADLEECLEASEEFGEDEDSNNVARFEQEDDDRCSVQTDEVLMIIVQFRRFLDSVEHELHQNLRRKCLRLEELKRQVDMLTQPVVWIRKRKLLYKKAFISRCHNLCLAETEVDLLGDQVESLVYLLEKIYVVLNRNAADLSVYFEVYDLLKLIKTELNNERSFKHGH